MRQPARQPARGHPSRLVRLLITLLAKWHDDHVPEVGLHGFRFLAVGCLTFGLEAPSHGQVGRLLRFTMCKANGIEG